MERRLREVVQNILDEPIPEKVKQHLLKPLRPSKVGKPIAPPRRKNVARRRALLEEFDPYPPNRNQIITNYQNELLRLYDGLEGVEQGRRFIRLLFSRRLTQTLTPSIMGRLREMVNTSFYLRYIYSFVIVNNEDGRSMIFYKQKRGSPWINNFAVAERWLNERENERLNLDNIERPNT